MAPRDPSTTGGKTNPDRAGGGIPSGRAPREGRGDGRLPDPRSEEELIAAIKGGEAGAWGELARRILPRIYGLCYRMLGKREEASDAAQAAMLRLVQVLDQYDSRSRFSTWAYRVTANICISRMRSAKVRRASSLDGAADAGSGVGPMLPQTREPDPRSGVERSDSARRLSAALASLDPDQRAILILRDGQDLSYEHIAEVLGIGLGTVKSRLFRARSALRGAMESIHPARAEEAAKEP